MDLSLDILIQTTAHCLLIGMFPRQRTFSNFDARPCEWATTMGVLWCRVLLCHVFKITQPQYLRMTVKGHCFLQIWTASYRFFLGIDMLQLWLIWLRTICFQNKAASVFVHGFLHFLTVCCRFFPTRITHTSCG